jgi:hypothetical protein
VINLEETHRRLARPSSHEQLGAIYREADRRGAQVLTAANEAVTRPIASLAAAIPSITTLSVAIHVLHSLPQTAPDSLGRQLLETAEQNAAGALRHCHRALELDGSRHDYTPDEWLPVVCERAAPLLESAQLGREPPTIVGQSQEAVSWLSQALVDLDRDSPEAAATMAETLARLLIVWVFAEQAAKSPRAITAD